MDLQTITAALEAATPGPYQVADMGHGSEVRTQGGSSVAWCGLTSAHQNTAANARLFAHAPQWLAALVAEVEALRSWRRSAALVLDTIRCDEYLCSPHARGEIDRLVPGEAWEVAEHGAAQTERGRALEAADMAAFEGICDD